MGNEMARIVPEVERSPGRHLAAVRAFPPSLRLPHRRGAGGAGGGYHRERDGLRHLAEPRGPSAARPRSILLNAVEDLPPDLPARARRVPGLPDDVARVSSLCGDFWSKRLEAARDRGRVSRGASVTEWEERRWRLHDITATPSPARRSLRGRPSGAASPPRPRQLRPPSATWRCCANCQLRSSGRCDCFGSGAKAAVELDAGKLPTLAVPPRGGRARRQRAGLPLGAERTTPAVGRARGAEGGLTAARNCPAVVRRPPGFGRSKNQAIKGLAMMVGGGRGIRTHDTGLPRITV